MPTVETSTAYAEDVTASVATRMDSFIVACSETGRSRA
jgi:hypothetical protein